MQTIPEGRPGTGGPPVTGQGAELVARGVRKRYGAVQALVDAHIDVRPGEVVALLGANGSGKSTLGRVLTGVTRPDGGTVEFDGAPVTFSSPTEARRMGIAAVYQELSLVPDMTVAENVWLGHEPVGLLGVDRAAMRALTDELLEPFRRTFDVPVGPDTVVGQLPPSARQFVEVVKALSWDPRVLILDEATASLDARQVDRLFEVVHDLRSSGKAIAFVSHRMPEIFRLADRAVVLRDGVTVGERIVADVAERELVEMLTGASAAPTDRRRPSGRPTAEGSGGMPPAVTLRGFSSPGLLPIDLEVQAGERLGLGGLQGQGQSRLLLALFGAAPSSGEVSLHGTALRAASPREAMAAGVAYVPGDRNAAGLLPVRSILENLQLPNWRRYGTPIRMPAARADAAAVSERLNVRYGAMDDPVATLSGGNAQKVVIGKWVSRDPTLLLLDDPTKGVDVGAKAEFYSLLDDLSDRDVTVILYSSDDDELLGLCSRVAVLHDGRLSAVLSGEELDHDSLVAASLGAERAAHR